MEKSWLSSNFKQDRIILAGDIGGTNTNLAIVGEKAGKYTIILKCVFSSRDITGVIDPLKEVIAEANKKNPSLKPTLCCLSPAGPVENNYCKLTNCKWDIDGNAIKKAIGIDTLIINDFLAIGYGIPTLDVNDPKQITKLPTTEGKSPTPAGTTKVVVGAGTGLGVGYLFAEDGKYKAHPSEGGHSGFAAFDEETKQLKDYVAKKIGMPPGMELFVSGQGISNVFNYFKDKKAVKLEGVLKEIDQTPDEDKPALISKNAKDNEVCKDIMKLFVRMYGIFAGSLGVIFLPFSGVYLAGGIATKNEWLFLEDDLFMKSFESNYNPNIRPLLKKIPVYIIKDYSISLYGAANAAVTLM
ncbi:MAG: glucokinase [Phycisphaerae bacterium]|jgi:glucokinase